MQCIIMEKHSHHDEAKKRAHDSQIVRAKENLKLSPGESRYRFKHQAPTHRLKLYVRAVIQAFKNFYEALVLLKC